jgi:citrate synthase
MSSKNPDSEGITGFWDRRRGLIRSRKGGWIIGEAVYNHGYSMMDELVGKVSFFQVWVLNTTGRLPERRLADWIEASFICLSWPDPRIWCNQVGTLAGCLRASPVAAVTAGALTSDSRLYGPGTALAATTFIRDAVAKKQAGTDAAEIVRRHLSSQGSFGGRQPAIAGYARPIASGDERVSALERVSEELGFPIGEHLALAYQIEEVLIDTYGEGMNITGYIAAFLMDQGFSPDESYRLFALCVSAGVNACYAEAADQPPESFLPLRCDDIEYQGTPARSVLRNTTSPIEPSSNDGSSNCEG